MIKQIIYAAYFKFIGYSYYLFNYLYYLIIQTKTLMPDIHPLHIYLSIILFFILIFLYIKIKYPFWNTQPIYHSYDFWRHWYSSPFVIQKNGPVVTKFYNYKDIKTITLGDFNNNTVDQCVNLLQCHYIPHENLLFTIKSEHFRAYMAACDSPTAISVYNEHKYKICNDASNTQIIVEDIPIGIITSKPITIFFQSKNKTHNKIISQYMDFICVHREKTQLNISRQLLHTHDFNMRKQNPDISISLFKKEIELYDGIVPLCKYKSYLYSLRSQQIPPLPDHYVLQHIYKENYDILFDFLNKLSYIPDSSEIMFDFYAIPSIGNIVAMILSKDLHIYCLRREKHIYGIYFLRDSQMIYENIDNGALLQCYGSICNSESPDLFFLGFQHAISAINHPKSKLYKLLLFDAYAHNTILLNYWNRSFYPILENQCAYYIYNFILPGMPINAEKCLFLV